MFTDLVTAWHCVKHSKVEHFVKLGVWRAAFVREVSSEN